MGKYAIVGLACLFPGAGTVDDYWQNLIGAVDARTDGGPEVFGHDPSAEDPDPEARHRIYCTRGGFVGAYSFDPAGYALPADYLAGLDRSFHWAIRAAGDALADAGLAAGGALPRAGVVFGNYPFPTPASSRLAERVWDSAVAHGLAAAGFPAAGLPAPGAALPTGPAAAHNLWAGGVPARVVGSALRLGGPQFTLDAACSSALYALKLACGYLEAGTADVMLAGGVCAPDPTVIHLSFSDLRAYPKDGFSQPFDARSKGIVTGQGAGMVVVKRLADARREGDRVYAVVDAVALTNDGPGKHVLAPNVTGQTASYALAHQEAGIDPSAIQYLECHATGTPLGDGVELGGVTDWFGAHGVNGTDGEGGAGRVPLLGSVKGNLGHLLTAAGVSSLIKVVLALAHGTIPPTLGVDRPLNATAADRVVREATAWPAPVPGQPRRAGVSAFGFGGTNAHVVLSEPGGSVPDAPAEATAQGAPGARAAVANDATTPLPRLAVIGMGAHFGEFSTLDAFERAGYEGRSAVRELPGQRWRGFEAVADGPLDRAGLAGDGVPPGGYVEAFDVDAASYRIPPKDLDHFNQQHLLMIRVAEEALRSAGFERPRTGTSGAPPRRVGVVLGIEMEPSAHGHGARYDLGRKLAAWCAEAGVDPAPGPLAELTRAARDGIHDSIEPNEVLSYIGNIMASRLSSLWNLTGPSFTVSSDTTCGAQALDVARLLLMDPTVEAVLVGAVDLAAGPENTLARALLEPDTARRTLGDGAGAVVVTRADAVPEGRVNYATVDSVVLRHSERPSVAPGVRAEDVARAAEDALAAAGLTPADVELVEACHAGGDRTAGRAELEGLGRVWSAERAGELTTALSGVSEAIGDTGCASALAGLIRAALCLHHACLPAAPSGVATDLLEGSALFLAQESAPWLRATRAGRRTASVSVTGTTGTVAHIVLGGTGTRGETVLSDWARVGGNLVVPVGADDIDALVRRIDELRERVASGGELAGLFDDSVEHARGARLRLVLVADGRDGLVRQLEQAAKDLPGVHRAGGEWASPSGSYYTARPVGTDGKVALVFPGAFNSYLGLGRALFRAFPGLLPRFEEQAERPAELLRSAALYPRARAALDRRALMRLEGELVEDIPLMLAAGTSYALLSTELVRDVLGVRVHGAFGYSLGESSMLFATGRWAKSARTDRKISASPLFVDQLRGPKRTVRALWGIPDDVPDRAVWATHVLLAPADEVRARLTAFDRVFITHVNTPEEVVVAGDPKQCQDLIEGLGCRSARSPANHVMHCPVVDGVLPELADLNRYPTGDAGDLVLYSSRDYAPVEDLDPDAVARNIAVTLRETVDFPRLVRRAYDDGFRCFIEAGPSSTCARWIEETLRGEPHLSVSVDRRGARGASDIARLVARLYAHGVDADLTHFRPTPTTKPAPGTRTFTVGGAPVSPLVATGAARAVAELPAASPRPPANEAVAPPAVRERKRPETPLPTPAMPPTSGPASITPSVPAPVAASSASGPAGVASPAPPAVAAPPVSVTLPAVGVAPSDSGPVSVALPAAGVAPSDSGPASVAPSASGSASLVLPAAGVAPSDSGPASVAPPPSGPASLAPPAAGAAPKASGPAAVRSSRSDPADFAGTVPGQEGKAVGAPVSAGASSADREPSASADSVPSRVAAAPLTPAAPRLLAPLVPPRGIVPVGEPTASAEELDVTMSLRSTARPTPALALDREPITTVPVASAPPAVGRPPAEPVADPLPAPVGARPPLPTPSAPAASDADDRPAGRLAALEERMLQAHREVIAMHGELRAQLALLLERTATAQASPAAPASAPAPTTPAPAARPPKAPGVVWDEHDLLEFATGRVANVFGERFAEIDGYRRRVRLPAPPYHFATRVTALDAEPGELRPSFIRTEYDVPQDAWYAVDGQVPPAVTIEAGQCDLLLISYLGADFTNRGERVYRLLDSTLSFVGDLPRVGQTLRYDIWIDQFLRHGDTLLFFFHYDCYADGELILKLTNACAGFFTDEELESSLGIIKGKAAVKPAGARSLPRSPFKPLAPTSRTTLTAADLALLADGRIADVFGSGHRQPEGCNTSLRLPAEKLRMVDEVTLIDRTGGREGLGRIEAVKNLVPDGWYFTCHFSDDPVLAGSLVAEGAVQLLQTYAFSLGLHLCLPDARFQPVPDLRTDVKVRGQITPDCARIEYRLDVTEVTLLPRPTVIADVTVLKDGKPAISVEGLGIRLREKPGTPYRPEAGGAVPEFLGRLGPSGEPALLNEFHMAHAAKGDLAVAMGPEFEIYADSRAPYIPNGDFLFVDRVMDLTGTRGTLKPGAVMVTEYDAPADAWYYDDNGHPYMPNCVYMESSLQAAILLGYYLGATLPYPDEQFSIRNLDGRATLVKDVDLRGKTIRHRSTMLSSAALPGGGSILQNFRYELSCDGEVFYTGESLFGYFNAKALEHQVGLDKGKQVPPWLDALPERPAGARRVDLAAYRAAEAGRSAARVGAGRLDLVEWLDLVPGGGRHGQGYLRGHRTIRPDDWYFSCHFHRDPVMPGSLGVEAVLQGMQVYAVETGLTDGLVRPRFALAEGTEMTWSYRGQILRTDPDMEFDVHIREVRRERGRIVLVGDASVWKSTLRIYELGGICVEIHHDE